MGPSRRFEISVPNEQATPPGTRATLAKLWRGTFDWLRGPAVQASLFGTWAGVLFLVEKRLLLEQEHMAGAGALARGLQGPSESELQEITIISVIFIVMAAMPKLFMFLGALIVSRRVQRRRLAVLPIFEQFPLQVEGIPANSPRLEAVLVQTEQQWITEHEMLSNIYVDRFVQHAGIYGFLTSIALALGGMTVMSRAIQGWLLRSSTHSDASIAECLSVSVVVAVVVTFARDFGRFLVRTASRDASAQMLSWSTRRLLAMLIFSGLVGAIAVKTDQFFKGAGDGLGNLWVAGVLGGLVAFFGERAANALADRVGAMFGLPKRRQPEVDLSDLDDMDDEDVARLAEEGIDSVRALADASAARLFYNTKYTLDRICDWQDDALLLRCVGGQRARAFREQLGALGATGARSIAVRLLASRKIDPSGTIAYTSEWDDTRKLLGFATDSQATIVFERLASDDLVLRLVLTRWATSARIEEGGRAQPDNAAVVGVP